jgi:hypothetical protein
MSASLADLLLEVVQFVKVIEQSAFYRRISGDVIPYKGK